MIFDYKNYEKLKGKTIVDVVTYTNGFDYWLLLLCSDGDLYAECQTLYDGYNEFDDEYFKEMGTSMQMIKTPQHIKEILLKHR